MIKFSVIIPIYNEEKYLKECLDSIVSQTLKDIEIICIDNGSNDQSLDIVKKYAKSDSRVIYRSIVRSDAGTARNVGLELAKGKYLYIIDSDDFCEKDLLEKCYKIIEREKSDILVFAADQFNDNTKEFAPLPHSLIKNHLPTKLPFDPKEMKDYLFNSFQNWAWNKVFRNDYIKSKGIKFHAIARTNDMRFTVMALAMANKISVLDEVLIHYRVGNDNSLQASNYLVPAAFWDAYKDTKKYLVDNGKYKLYERSILNHFLSGTIHNYNSLRTEESKRYIYYLIKYGSKFEFDFLAHDKLYYYDVDCYDEMKKIINGKTEDELTIDELKGEINRLKIGIDDIKKSFSYKIGLAVTSIPRKVKKKHKKGQS